MTNFPFTKAVFPAKISVEVAFPTFFTFSKSVLIFSIVLSTVFILSPYFFNVLLITSQSQVTLSNIEVSISNFIWFMSLLLLLVLKNTAMMPVTVTKMGYSAITINPFFFIKSSFKIKKSSIVYSLMFRIL